MCYVCLIDDGYSQVFYLKDILYLEKAMAPHSSTLAWRTPWMEEPGGLAFPSLEEFSTVCCDTHWHPTPVLLPGKSHGWRSLVGCSPWGR